MMWLGTLLVGCSGSTTPVAWDAARSDTGETDCALAVWYADDDHDLWGDASRPVKACRRPTRAADRPGDCDDGNPNVNPAQFERCGNAVDENCDGTTVCPPRPEDVARRGITLDVPAVSMSPVGDLDGDGLVDLAIAIPHYSNSLAAVFAWDGGALRQIHDVRGGAPASAIASAGDFDGDGDPDFAVGNGDCSFEGETFVNTVNVFTSPLPTVGAKPGFRYGGQECSGLGGHVALVGDIDDDGADEIAATASHGVEVFAHHAIDPIATITAPESGRFTALTGPVDLNGDGSVDLLGTVAYVPDRAEIQVEFDLFPGAYVNADHSDVRLAGPIEANAVLSVAGSDLDGDGHVDLLVGAPAASVGAYLGGAVYLVRGPILGRAALAETAAVTMYGEHPGFAAGSSVAILGDVQANGAIDIAIGAPLAEHGTIEVDHNSGIVYVVEPPEGGSWSLEDVAYRLVGSYGGDRLGTGVAGLGDVNGDDADDLGMWSRTDVEAWIVLGGSP